MSLLAYAAVLAWLAGPYLITFVAVAALDFVWARYTIACAEKKAFLAGVASIVIYGFGGLVTISYIANHWLLLPVAAGSFLGTFVSVRLHKEKPAS